MPCPTTGHAWSMDLLLLPVLLGVVALRTGTTIYWDSPEMKATNAPEADSLIRGYFWKNREIP